MLPLNITPKSRHALAVFVFILCIFPAITAASDALELETFDAKKLELVSGKSIILRSTQPIKRISIADPEIADFLLLSANEIYLKGKSAGITNLTLWQNSKVVAVYDLEVVYDLSRLKQELHNILPEESDLRVVSTNNSITLSGKISNASNLSQALGLVNAYAPDGKVNNLVEVGGVGAVVDPITREVVMDHGVPGQADASGLGRGSDSDRGQNQREKGKSSGGPERHVTPQ